MKTLCEVFAGESKRGGKRPGSGRKPRKTPMVPLCARIEPELYAKLEKAKGAASWPKFLTALLEKVESHA